MNTLQSGLHNEQLTFQIQSFLEEKYDLGKLARIQEIFGGYCNKSYGVWMVQGDGLKKFLLREYNPKLSECEIRFEHALLNHLKQNGFDVTAGVIPCRDGATFVKTASSDHSAGDEVYWALFDFLEGEDKYHWTKTDLTVAEFTGAAEMLAKLHFFGRDFVKPDGADRAQPPILEFISTFKTAFSAYADPVREGRFYRLFRDNQNQIFSVIDEFPAVKERFQGMPVMPIHCDYHPGNLKFDNEKVVGIFDFDWSKIDYRLFDVALGLVYFTSVWTGEAAGSLQPDRLRLFLKSYNDTCRRQGRLDPLSGQEQKNLLPMLTAANLYVLNWDLVEHDTTRNPDKDVYYTYLEHNIRLMHWLDTRPAGIQNSIQKACS
jgi:homoserine kinase type II